jgi:hypothetical protein
MGLRWRRASKTLRRDNWRVTLAIGVESDGDGEGIGGLFNSSSTRTIIARISNKGTILDASGCSVQALIRQSTE